MGGSEPIQNPAVNVSNVAEQSIQNSNQVAAEQGIQNNNQVAAEQSIQNSNQVAAQLSILNSNQVADETECDLDDPEVLGVKGPEVKDMCNSDTEIARPKRKLYNLGEWDDDTSEGTHGKEFYVDKHKDATFTSGLNIICKIVTKNKFLKYWI